MDRLSFVSSLLLIVSVTATLGSVIKAKNPNGEELEKLRSEQDSSSYPEMPRNPKELEALLKRSHDTQAKLKGEKSSRDKDSEMSKRIGQRRGIRHVSITIKNTNASYWKDPFIFKAFGFSAENTLPAYLESGNEGSFKTYSNFYDFLGGTSGVFTYRIPIIQKSLAVMWASNPVFNCAWNVKLYDNYPSPDEDMYRELARDRFPGDSSTHKRLIGGGLKVSGLMTCGNNSVLRITVLKYGKA